VLLPLHSWAAGGTTKDSEPNGICVCVCVCIYIYIYIYIIKITVSYSSEAHPAPIQWVMGSFPGGKVRLRCDADHFPQSSAMVKN
jgi:hypothetical protein